jgi:hypothetical protein
MRDLATRRFLVVRLKVPVDLIVNPQRSRTGSVLLLPDTAERAAKMRHIPILLVITSSQPSRRKRTSRALFGLVQSQDPNLVGMVGAPLTNQGRILLSMLS